MSLLACNKYAFLKLKLIPPCSVSKQQAIVPGQCYELEDGTSSFKDFHGSRNNRFTSPEQAAKNRIQHPSNVLHFFNAQPDVTPEVFSQVCRTRKYGCVLCIVTWQVELIFALTIQTITWPLLRIVSLLERQQKKNICITPDCILLHWSSVYGQCLKCTKNKCFKLWLSKLNCFKSLTDVVCFADLWGDWCQVPRQRQNVHRKE